MILIETQRYDLIHFLFIIRGRCEPLTDVFFSAPRSETGPEVAKMKVTRPFPNNTITKEPQKTELSLYFFNEVVFENKNNFSDDSAELLLFYFPQSQQHY